MDITARRIGRLIPLDKEALFVSMIRTCDLLSVVCENFGVAMTKPQLFLLKAYPMRPAADFEGSSAPRSSS